MTTNGTVASTDNLKPNPDAPPPAETQGEDAPPPKRSRRRRKKDAEAPPSELTTEQLAALGTLTIEAAKKGLSIDEYADTYLVPLAEAYAAWKAVSGD